MEKDARAGQGDDWRSVELILLGVLLISKIIIFAARLDVSFGYDDGGHLQAMSSVSWIHPFFDLRSFYYASHPALGFLLANTASALAMASPLIGAQIVSFASSLAGFFFLRATLKKLDLLQRPDAIIFLYLAAALPIQVYMQAAVNLDVIVFAWGAAVLYGSVCIMQTKRNSVLSVAVACTGLAMAAACLTKESGILLFALFPIVAVVFGKNLRLQIKRYLVMAGVALSLAVPYYTVNYYLPEGSFFYMAAGNTDWIEAMDESVRVRDADLGAFAWSYIARYPGGEARLLRTWRAGWRMEDRPAQSETAERFIRFYLAIVPWLLLLGGAMYFVVFSPKDIWHRFGVVLLSFAFVQVLFLIVFVYRYPVDGHFHNKGIYIAPAFLAVCYLLSNMGELPELLPDIFRRWKPLWRRALIAFVTFFVVANHIVPVY